MSKETEAEIAKAFENAMEIFDPLDLLLDEVAEDPGAPFRPELLAELADLKHEDEAAYDAKLSKLKDAGVQIGTLDKAIIDLSKMDKPALTPADVILRIADEFELFHSSDKTAYADVYVEGHRETYPIASKSFEHLLRARVYKQTSEAVASEAVRKSIDLLKARAEFEGPMRPVFIRVAGVDEVLYIDLGSEDWSAVEISCEGWKVTQNPPVRFCRSAGMLPLTVPESGGRIEALRQYVNVSTDEDFVLVVMWLVAALRYGGPYPVMVLVGEQGTAKSTTSKILRMLVDPNSAPLRSIPREERDLLVSAKHAHVLAFDNLSSLNLWTSNCLCRLATGGGHAARALYTNDDEILFDAKRPVILNGIEQIVTREDLADRSIFITPEPIASGRRVSERELLANFEKDRASILGALLGMMVHGLRALPGVKLDDMPRMADFVTWATACEGAVWRLGTFQRAYAISRAEAVETVLETDAVAVCVKELVARTMRTMRTQDCAERRVYNVWGGTASELLAKLKKIATDNLERDGTWPKSAKELSNRLRQATPFLRECGIEITRKREGHDRERMIYITLIGLDVDRSSAPSASSARESDRPQSAFYTALRFEEDKSVDSKEISDASSSSTFCKNPKADNSASVNPPKPKGIPIKLPKKKI
jgi:hypothetical protein